MLSEVKRLFVSARKDGFGFGGWCMRNTVMEHVKAGQSTEERSLVERF